MELGITMSRNFFGLVLLFLFCMKQSQETINDDQSHETSEFNSEQRTMLGNFTGESRSFFKKDLWRWKELMEKKRLQLYGEFFISWFRCAIGTAKFTIDRAFLIPRSFFVKENLEDIPLPEDFSNLNNTHDRWIDDAFHLKQKKKTVLSKYPLSPPTQRMKEAYLLWYNLIKKKKELRLYQDIVTVNAIADDLKKIRSSNPSKYPDDETIYRRFAASLARSYRIVDCVQHDLDLKLFENAKKYPEKKFSKVLLEMIPKWYLSHEDIVFLNVLLKAYTRKSADRIKCIVVENENHEWVAVPYEISENCGRDDINATFAEGFSTIHSISVNRQPKSNCQLQTFSKNLTNSMSPISSFSKKIPIFLFLITIISHYRNELVNANQVSCKEILSELLDNSKSPKYRTSSVEIIDKCHSNYTEQETRQKCENKSISDIFLFQDIFLFKPVTVEKNNITYWNIYCAICNREKNEFSFWNVALSFELNNGSKYVQVIDDRSIFDVLETKNSSWASKPFNGTISSMPVHRLLPLEMKKYTKNCSKNDIMGLDLNNSPSKDKIFEEINLNKKSNHRCIYYDEYGDKCKQNEFFIEGFTFTRCDNGEAIGISKSNIFFKGRCKKTENDVDFNGKSWYFHHFNVGTNYSGFQGSENWMFVCGKEISTGTEVWRKVEIFFRCISVISIVVYLVLAYKANKSNLNPTLPNITLYMYSLEVLILSIYYQSMHPMEDCFVKYSTLIYFIWYNVFCVLIFIYETGRSIVSPLRATESSKKDRRRRSLVYFVLISILSLIPTFISKRLIEDAISQIPVQGQAECPTFSNYYIKEYSFSLCHNYVTILEEKASLIYLLFGALLIAPTMFFVCLVKWDKLRSTIKKDPLCLLARATYLMSLYWVVILCLFFKYQEFGEISNIIGRAFLSIHGVGIFFVFGFKREMLMGILSQCGFNVKSRVTRTEVNLVEVSREGNVALVEGNAAEF